MVDPGRIELPPDQCEWSVLPLNYGPREFGGPEGTRTPNLLHAMEAR